jgi:hypothetical protein
VGLSPHGEALWARVFGDAGDQEAAPHKAVAVGGDGRIALAGTFSGDIDFGDGATLAGGAVDGFVALIDAQGNAFWAKALRHPTMVMSERRAAATAIDVDGNVYVCGSFINAIGADGAPVLAGVDADPDAFILKLDPDGEPVWLRGIHGQEVRCSALAVGSGGSIAAVGTFVGAVASADAQLQPTGADRKTEVFVASIDDVGVVWWRALGSAQDDAATGVSVDSVGNVTVVGSVGAAAAVSGGPAALPAGGGRDLVIVKFDAIGNHVWSRQAGDGADQHASAVAADPTGALVLVGNAAGVIDLGAGPSRAAGGNDALVARLAP